MLARIVVVDNVVTWNALSLSNEPLILIPRFEDDAALGRAKRTGHRVVVALGAESTSGSSEEVQRLARGDAEEALRGMGIKEKKIQSLATLARRSMTCFRRELALRPEIKRPRWAQSNAGMRLVPTLLTGVWDDTSEADRAVLSTLARCDYETFSDSVSQWVGASDPPLRRVGDVFELVSREDSWTQLADTFGATIWTAFDGLCLMSSAYLIRNLTYRLRSAGALVSMAKSPCTHPGCMKDWR